MISMHPGNLSIADFNYTLPEEKIAFFPLEQRDQSKLLVYKKGNIEEAIYANIADQIPSLSFMVFNNTRVIPARMLFQKPTGGIIEIFCLEPREMYADITQAMGQKDAAKWLCLLGGASKWKKGQVLNQSLHVDNEQIHVEARYIEKQIDNFVIEFKWDNNNFSFADIMELAGQMPLPPYIKRKPTETDTDRYQTVYAKFNGSVAAPTAGLHFTETILQQLQQKNIAAAFVTLHVGASTFKPVKATHMQDHNMHAEYITVAPTFIKKLLTQLKQPVIAVGTTSMRTLESLYWLGVKLLQQKDVFKNRMPQLEQWEAYNLEEKKYTIVAALEAVLHYIEEEGLSQLIAKTQIIIAPGYKCKIVDGLVTNFHQPSSTLLLLVAAFIGNDWKKVYNYALHNDFRFLSYGDGSLLWRKNI